MATLDRIEPRYRAWSPSASGVAVPDEDRDAYVGRHRRPGGRLVLRRLFYVARHRVR